MMPPKFVFCGGPQRSAVRNDQLHVRICLESELPTLGKEEAVQADGTLAGKYLRDTTQRIRSPRLSRMAVPPVDASALQRGAVLGL